MRPQMPLLTFSTGPDEQGSCRCLIQISKSDFVVVENDAYFADHPIAHTMHLGTKSGRPRRTVSVSSVDSLNFTRPIPGGMEQSPRPWLGCTCGSRHSFASSASSGSGWGNGRQSLNNESLDVVRRELASRAYLE
jgi:hypothetical protein